LHEKVLNRITTCHERLSSNGLPPKEFGQLNFKILKENWQKSSNRPLQSMRNQSNSRLEPMYSLTHRRNLSSQSRASRGEERADRPPGAKKKTAREADRPVMALLTLMNADMTRLRHSVALEGYKHLKKTPPFAHKKTHAAQKKAPKLS
jgi:hypothetical protein